MRSGTDWSTIWPVVAAAGAFGVVYTTSLVAGAPVEEVLTRATGAMLAVGLASLVLRAIILAALPDEPPARPRIDFRLPEVDPAADDSTTMTAADTERRPPAAA